MSNICQINGVNWAMAKTAKFKHILGVFWALDDQIQLISFALFQASRDTSFEYSQLFGNLWNSTFLGLTPLWGPPKLFCNAKMCFPILSYILPFVTTIDTCRYNIQTLGGILPPKRAPMSLRGNTPLFLPSYYANTRTSLYSEILNGLITWKIVE